MKTAILFLAAAVAALQLQAIFAAESDGLAEVPQTVSLGGVAAAARCVADCGRDIADGVSAIMRRCGYAGSFTSCVALGAIELLQDVIVAVAQCLHA